MAMASGRTSHRRCVMSKVGLYKWFTGECSQAWERENVFRLLDVFHSSAEPAASLNEPYHHVITEGPVRCRTRIRKFEIS